MRGKSVSRPVPNWNGRRFGRWLVLGISDHRGNCGQIMWRCQCSCGVIKDVAGAGLSSGRSSSCGCLNKEIVSRNTGVDISGMRYGLLTVVSQASCRQPKNGAIRWECVCDCGNTTIVTGSALRNGRTLSCGCYRDRRVSETHHRDLTDMRFGRLTAINRSGTTGNGSVLWRCLCSCGKYTVVRSDGLIDGGTQSCGCKHLTDYDGYRFRSKWELFWFVASKQIRVAAEYEKTTFCLDVGGRITKYTPDFRISGTDVFVEVKGRRSEVGMVKYYAALRHGVNVHLVQKSDLESWCGCDVKTMYRTYSENGITGLSSLMLSIPESNRSIPVWLTS